MPSTTLTIGLAQIAPVWLLRDETIDKVVTWIARAAADRCALVVFGEALVPGYPFWIERTDGARFNSDDQKTLYAHYVQQAVCIEAGDLDPVCQAASKHSIAVYLGIMERAPDRGGHSVYATMVYISSSGVIESAHRKLVPTYEERLVWASGDGHGLTTHALGAFTLGGLNCWENWLPLARSALYAQGEDLHVAIWPGNVRNTQDITRFIACEARAFVASASGVMRRQDIPDGLPEVDLLRECADEVMADGGSCLAGPDGEWLIEPAAGRECLLVADIDHRHVLMERQNLDVAGHYSRPDVTRLVVNRQRQSTAEFTD